MKYYCDQFGSVTRGPDSAMKFGHHDTDLADSLEDAKRLRIEFFEREILKLKTRILQLKTREPTIYEIDEKLHRELVSGPRLAAVDYSGIPSLIK